MPCINHHNQNGVNTCCQCGEWLCEVCSVDVNDRFVCKSCIAKNMLSKTNGHGARVSGPSAFAGHRAPPRYASGCLLLICSFIVPGANYMYLGLVKRGLFVMSAFFAIIFAITASHHFPQLLVVFLFLSILVLWFTTFFDAFAKRRLINSGIHVPDNVDDILGFVKKYKVLLIIFAVVWLALAALSAASRFIPVLAVIIGVYLIVKALKKKKGPEDGGPGNAKMNE